jgi:predicted amidohydrolase YtcJ
MTERRYRKLLDNCGPQSILGRTLSAWQLNDRNLIRSGALLMLATDAGVSAPDMLTDPSLRDLQWWVAGEDRLARLGEGHFHWLKAMEELGLAPMDILRAATRNVAAAYRKERDLGTLEPGKIADIVILDKDPLQSAENYRAIHAVIKDGAVVDTSSLPIRPMLSHQRAESIANGVRQADAIRFPRCC